jgi:hypothetical protein
VDREGRRSGVKELLGMIVREDDPKIGLQRTQPPTDISGYLADVRDDCPVFVIRVKNWGACGNIAPPITVDIIDRSPSLPQHGGCVTQQGDGHSSDTLLHSMDEICSFPIGRFGRQCLS